MRKPMHFPYDEVYHRKGNRMGKQHPYYGKNMSTNFPGSPRTMDFTALSRATGS